jgi:outer membrane immunogenic protein
MNPSSATTALCLAAALSTLAASFAAADGRSKRAATRSDPVVYQTPEYNWQGLYLGASIGYGWGTSVHEYNRNDNHGSATQELSGGLASLTLGYNFLLSPSFLAGIEADLGIMDLSAADKVIFDGHVWKSSFGPMWGTMRARAGFLMGPRTLVYGTGGLAFMDVDEIGYGDAAGQTAWNRKFRTGWTIGAGLEHAISAQMTAKIEYLYMDFGRLEGLSENRETYAFENSASLLRVGVNWRF